MNKFCSIVLVFIIIIGMLCTVITNPLIVEAAETNDTPIKLVMKF